MPEDPTIEHKLAIRCRGVTKIAARSRHKRSRRTEILVLPGSARDFDQFPWPFKMHPPKQFQKCRFASYFTVILIQVIKNTRFFNVFGDLGILGFGRWDFVLHSAADVCQKKLPGGFVKGVSLCAHLAVSGKSGRTRSIIKHKKIKKTNVFYSILIIPAPQKQENTRFFTDLLGPFLVDLDYTGNLDW